MLEKQKYFFKKCWRNRNIQKKMKCWRKRNIPQKKVRNKNI